MIRDDKGSVALEAAFILPLVVVCMLAIVDAAMVGLAAGALEHAAWTVQRALAAGMTEAQALEAARQDLRVMVLISPADLIIDGDILRDRLRIVGALTRLIFPTDSLATSLAGATLGGE